MKNFYSEKFIKINEKHQLPKISDEEFINEMNFWESEENTVPTIKNIQKERKRKNDTAHV